MLVIVQTILLAPVEGVESEGKEVQFVHIPTGMGLITQVPALGTWEVQVTSCKQLIEAFPEHVPTVSKHSILVL
jgi:hypothetical protein